MKIAVTGTRGIPGVMGGVETHCEELFPRIAAMGLDVTVIRRSTYVDDSIKSWYGVKLVDIDTPRKKAFEAVVHTFKAVNWAVRNKCDVIHINAIGPALLTPYAKLLGMKVVFTHHGTDYDRQKWGRTAKLMLKIGERLGCTFADDVIVISQVIKDVVAEKYGRTENVHLIPNGVSDAEFCDFPEYFDQLGIERNRFVFTMSRFVPEKRLEDAIDAFFKSGLERKGYKLVIAGDADFEDDYSRRIKTTAREMGIVLTGFIKGKKLHSLLSSASLVVLTSSHEGLSIALLEAMSYGLPVVVSDIPANIEVGLDESSYYHLYDTDELAVKMLACMNNASPEYNMNKYDWDNIASKVSEIYKKFRMCET